MLVADVMQSDPKYLFSYESCRAAARRMRDENIGFLPVCDRHRHVLGTITDRDIALRIVGEAQQYDLPVGDVMTRELVACHPGDDLSHAERMMATCHKSRIVVLDGMSVLVGVVSLTDIARYDSANAAAVVARVAERVGLGPERILRTVPVGLGARPRIRQADRTLADRGARDGLEALSKAQRTP